MHDDVCLGSILIQRIEVVQVQTSWSGISQFALEADEGSELINCFVADQCDRNQVGLINSCPPRSAPLSRRVVAHQIVSASFELR